MRSIIDRIRTFINHIRFAGNLAGQVDFLTDQLYSLHNRVDRMLESDQRYSVYIEEEFDDIWKNMVLIESDFHELNREVGTLADEQGVLAVETGALDRRLTTVSGRVDELDNSAFFAEHESYDPPML